MSDLYVDIPWGKRHINDIVPGDCVLFQVHSEQWSFLSVTLVWELIIVTCVWENIPQIPKGFRYCIVFYSHKIHFLNSESAFTKLILVMLYAYTHRCLATANWGSLVWVLSCFIISHHDIEISFLLLSWQEYVLMPSIGPQRMLIKILSAVLSEFPFHLLNTNLFKDMSYEY